MIKFLKKHKSGICSLLVALLIFGLMVLIIYFSNEDKKKLIYTNNIDIQENDILYKNDINNIFGSEWANAYYYIGAWNTGDEFNPYYTYLEDDLIYNVDYIGKYFVDLNAPVSNWNNNALNYFSANEFPYFEIRFNTYKPIYQMFSLLINNIGYYSGSLWIDVSITSPNNEIIVLNDLTCIASNGCYFILNNTEYYNYNVNWIRFRSGMSYETNDDIGFIERFGSSYTYSPYINVVNGVDRATYQDLYNRYNDLSGRYDALNSAFSYEQNQYLSLSQDYNTLLEQYNTLLNQTEYSFSELFWSLSAVPFNFISSGFNVDILGVNIGAILTGLFTAGIVIWLLKKLFK